MVFSNSSNIFTFEDFFSAKRSSTVAHPTVWSLPLYCGSNIIYAKTSVSRSVQVNFVFPFFSKKQLLYWTPFWNRHPKKPYKNIETSPSHVEPSSKNRLLFHLNINLETDHPSKTIYPAVGTSSRRARRRISLRRILLHNSSSCRIYT